MADGTSSSWKCKTHGGCNWTRELLVILRSLITVGAISLVVVGPLTAAAVAGDLGLVPLFDGERADALNTWGGPFNAGTIASFAKQSTIVRSGAGAYRANLGSIPNDGFRFFQTFSSGVSGFPGYRQDRDLTQYQTLSGYVRNDTAVPLTFSLELKDYRDSNSHRASRSYTLPAGAWTHIDAPLDLGSGWNVDGSPDLARTFAVSFLVDADFGDASGSLYLDDFTLQEKGPSIDVATAPIDVVVERLARRQFLGLWSARNKTSGLIPNSPDNIALAALNTTTGVVWSLPAAIRRGWVTQGEADAYMTQLVGSLNTNRDQTTYLPTRFLNLVTAGPGTDNREESSVDAAFIALALHRYKSQPATPEPVRTAIETLENRFDWQAFATPTAFRLAYFAGTGFSPYTYSGYTNENKVIALAAEASTTHHVPLVSMWNDDVGRVDAFLVDPAERFLTYSYGTEYRAPFGQALVNLFVDTSTRGVDSFPNRSLARNPWVNFLRYEAEVSARLDQLGRDNFVQPDAGNGAAGYQPYNLFNNFGQPNLFMPWSVSLSLLAGAEGAEEALRFLLDNGLGTGLDGPLGLTDSAQWATGAANPTAVPSVADNWNTTLSTLALLEFLDRYQGVESGSQFFAALPEIDSALDFVFRDGDLNGNGVTDSADLAILRSGFGAAAFATPATGDADGDGDVDGADFLRWQRGVGATPSAAAASIPEPAISLFLSQLVLVAVLGRRKRGPLTTA
jgi:hypothetical protein